MYRYSHCIRISKTTHADDNAVGSGSGRSGDALRLDTPYSNSTTNNQGINKTLNTQLNYATETGKIKTDFTPLIHHEQHNNPNNHT